MNTGSGLASGFGGVRVRLLAHAEQRRQDAAEPQARASAGQQQHKRHQHDQLLLSALLGGLGLGVVAGRRFCRCRHDSLACD
jgi:hypothetical protein